MSLNDALVRSVRPPVTGASIPVVGKRILVTGADGFIGSHLVEDLVKKGVIAPLGSGRGAHYEFLKKRLMNGSNGSSGGRDENGS